jgi:cation diffusion facilitator family transporter
MHNHNDRDIDISDPMRSLGNSSNERKDYTGSLRDGILVTLIFFVIEVAGGYYSGSLSLISDAGHMFIDASALLLSLAAIRAARSLPTKERTYGLHRAEIVAAFCNGLFLVIVSVWILYEAISRLANPRPVDSTMMLVIALAGLAANAYIAYRLHGSQGSEYPECIPPCGRGCPHIACRDRGCGLDRRHRSDYCRSHSLRGDSDRDSSIRRSGTFRSGRDSPPVHPPGTWIMTG